MGKRKTVHILLLIRCILLNVNAERVRVEFMYNYLISEHSL
jgi:hypothetical protein